jgi:hypothetical protein
MDWQLPFSHTSLFLPPFFFFFFWPQRGAMADDDEARPAQSYNMLKEK